MSDREKLDISGGVSKFPAGESPFRTKGMLWLGVRAYLDAKVPGGADAIANELDPQARAFFTQMFVAPSWYDVFPILTIADVASRLLDIDKFEYVKRSAQYHAEQDMTGVYKALLATRSPLAVCKRFGSIHSQMYDFGKAQVVREEPNRVDALATGMPEPLAWWWRRASECYVMPVLRAAGAKNPRLVWQPQQPDGTRDGVKLVRIPSYTAWN